MLGLVCSANQRRRALGIAKPIFSAVHTSSCELSAKPIHILNECHAKYRC